MVFSMQGHLMSFAMKLTLNKDEAQDLVQDTNLRALKNEAKFVDASNPKGWLLTIMRNIFINNYRKVVRTATVVDRTDDLYHLNISQESGLATPEGTVSVIEISAAINSFSDDYRIPFTMHVSGYKYHEIAKEMNLPLGTVKSRIFFARQRLQKMLQEYR